MWLKGMLAASTAALCLGAGASQAAAPFETDVTASIDKGIAWLATRGAFNNPSSAGDAVGLTTLALLEKRASNDLDAAPSGYNNATDVDKERLRKSVAYILGRVGTTTFDLSYRDGAYMMALSVYLKTGGPDRGEHADLPATLPYSLVGALNLMFDRFKSYQRASGYWCYGPSFTSCDDSSTTQFVIAGLAALRGIYSEPAWADAVRLADLNTMTEKARQAYVTNGIAGGATCGDLGNEKGHGYNRGNTPSPQQTASATWIQLAGGADVNDASVQQYLRWLRNRYRYSDIASVSGDWNFNSYWYYLWSSSKSLLFIRDSDVPANAGNITPASFGVLPAGDAPACNVRQVHRDPATLPRIALFGADGPGYYAAEAKDFYFDYASTILGYQCADGSYACNGAPGRWNDYSRQAYALLVLLRSVGGGCVDSDKDGICDSDEGQDEQVEALYCDYDGDGTVEISDVRMVGAIITGKPQLTTPLTPENEWANYANYGSSANSIDANDYWQCWYAAYKRLPPKYYTTNAD